MKLFPIWKRVPRSLRAVLGGGGLILPVFGGCEPEVQSLLLTGIQELSVTLIDALFTTIQLEEQSGTSAVTTSREIITTLTQMLC